MLRAVVLLGGLCVCALLPAWALASSRRAAAGGGGSGPTSSRDAAQTGAKISGARSVRLKASFSPERLGAGTTVHLSFQVLTPAGAKPVPLTDIEVLYPNELGIATSDLGLESCSVARLEAGGVKGCPHNSLMGYGSAIVDVPLSASLVLETAKITLLAGPVENGRLGLLFFASGEFPVLAEFVFPGQILPAPTPFGGVLDAKLPLIPSVPEGPDAAIVHLNTTLGPGKIVYHEKVNGKTIAFRPKGILLPKTCPKGGFPFTVHLGFVDGTASSGSTTVPCPRGH